jgi:hypothetical protein
MYKWLCIICAFLIINSVNAQNPYEEVYKQYKDKAIELTNTEYKVVRVIKTYEVIEILKDTVRVTTETHINDYIADSIKLRCPLNSEETYVLFTDYKVVDSKLIEIKKESN